MLTIEAIQKAVTTRWLGKPVHYWPSLASTNDKLKQMAETGAPPGTMIVTDYQSEGKGRLNRRWEAPPATSLLVSVLFRPNWSSDKANWLTMIAGLAAISAVRRETSLLPFLKWPNDLVIQVEGQWRKFGGLLLEAQFVEDNLVYAVLGSGINVNISLQDLPETITPATSLLAVSGQPVDRLALLNSYLMELEMLYEAAESGKSPRMKWAEALITPGNLVQVSGQTLEEPIEGIAEGVDEWGRLRVREGNGRLHVLSAGDVTLRG